MDFDMIVEMVKVCFFFILTIVKVLSGDPSDGDLPDGPNL